MPTIQQILAAVAALRGQQQAAQQLPTVDPGMSAGPQGQTFGSGLPPQGPQMPMGNAAQQATPPTVVPATGNFLSALRGGDYGQAAQAGMSQIAHSLGMPADPQQRALVMGNILANNRGTRHFGAGLAGGLNQAMNQQSIQERTQLQKDSIAQRKAELDMTTTTAKAVQQQAQGYMKGVAGDANGDGVVSPEEQRAAPYIKLAALTGKPEYLAKAEEIMHPEPAKPANLIGEVSPNTNTPDSVQEFMRTGDYSKLKPRDPPVHIVKNVDGTTSVYDATTGTEIGGRDAETVISTAAKVKAGKAATDFRLGYPAAVTGLQDTINKIVSVKKDMAGLPTGPGGEIAALGSAKLQEIGARLGEFTLDKIAEFKNKGVSLSPMTERDFEFLKSLSGSITKFPAANMALLDRAQQAAQRIQDDLNYQMQYLDSGGDLLEYKGRPRPKLQDAPAANSGWSVKPK